VDLVVIDTVDAHRNLAAALRPEKLWNFVAAGREFLRNPGLWYFFPPNFKSKNRSQFAKQIDVTGREVSAVLFKHPVLVPDVLWGELMKLERSLLEMMAREGVQAYGSTLWSVEQQERAILVKSEQT